MMDAITKAKVQMIITSPFFATLALSMEYVPDETIDTACTDGKEIRYNPTYVNSLKKEQVIGLIVHELLHISNLHHLRLEARDPEKFNIAADYVINEIATEAGYKLPPGALIDSTYRGMSAEEVYGKLPPSSKKPIGLFKKAKNNKEEESRVKSMVAKAAAIARQQGKMPQHLERMVQDVIEPTQNWKEVLVRFLTEQVKGDYTWKEPNRRYLPTYLPSVETISVLGEIVLIVDTSGSIDSKLLNLFAGEIQDICKMMNKSLVVLYVDTRVAGVQIFEPDDHIVLSPKGGGGTSFIPGFDYINKADMSPACLIYFTDGYCDLFPPEPNYPVLWTVYNNNYFKPTFGETIKIKQL